MYLLLYFTSVWSKAIAFSKLKAQFLRILQRHIEGRFQDRHCKDEKCSPYVPKSEPQSCPPERQFDNQ